MSVHKFPRNSIVNYINKITNTNQNNTFESDSEEDLNEMVPNLNI